MLAMALIGWGKRIPLRARLREISADLVTLIFGVAVFLVWAGLVEAFLSQYHEPIIPYSVKIVFGLVELVLLILFLAKSGTTRSAESGCQENPSATSGRGMMTNELGRPASPSPMPVPTESGLEERAGERR